MRAVGTLGPVGTVGVVGTLGPVGRCRERYRDFEVRSDVITEESSVWVCPLNEERGFVDYIFS